MCTGRDWSKKDLWLAEEAGNPVISVSKMKMYEESSRLGWASGWKVRRQRMKSQGPLRSNDGNPGNR